MKGLYLYFYSQKTCNFRFKLAGPQGLEPRTSGPKPDVLPLHHGPPLEYGLKYSLIIGYN